MKSIFSKPPEFLSLPFFGLNITKSSVRIIKFKNKNIGRIPYVIEDVPFVEKCDFFTNDSYSNCEEIKKILKVLKKKYKINFVQLSIPEQNTYVFRVGAPVKSADLIEDFISNNIEQYIPLTASDVYFDYKILKNQMTKDLIPVIVTAIPRIVVEKYTNLLESCGIYTIACEPETHAIARCVIDKGDMNPYIIINIDNTATNISVVEDGFVQYTQTLAINSKDVSNSMSTENAILLKDSINKVIIFWFTSKDINIKNSKIENIILTGDNIENSDLVNFLESNLFVNATYANVWKNCFDINKYIPKITKEESLKFATCIGLSMFKVK